MTSRKRPMPEPRRERKQSKQAPTIFDDDTSEASNDEDEDVSVDDQKKNKRNTGRKLTSNQGDIFIGIMLDHFDVIENKSTDASLTGDALSDVLLSEWTEIQTEFLQKTGVNIG